MACPKLGEMSIDLWTRENCLLDNLYLECFSLNASDTSLCKILNFNDKMHFFFFIVSRASDAATNGFHPSTGQCFALYQPDGACNNDASTGRGVRIAELDYFVGIYFPPRMEQRVNIFSGMGHTMSTIITQETQGLKCGHVPTWSCSRLDQTISERLSSLYWPTAHRVGSQWKEDILSFRQFPNLTSHLQRMLNWCWTRGGERSRLKSQAKGCRSIWRTPLASL